MFSGSPSQLLLGDREGVVSFLSLPPFPVFSLSL